MLFRGQSRCQALWLAGNQNGLQSRSYGWLQSVSKEYHLWFDLASDVTFAAACDWLGHVSSVTLWLTIRITVDPETSMDLCPTVQVPTKRPLLSNLRLHLPTPPSIVRIQNIADHG